MAITSGFVYSCSSAGVGGISNLYIGNASEITITRTAGVADTISYAPGKKFYAVTFEDDGCTFTETIEVVNNHVIYKPEYKIKIGSKTDTARSFIESLAGCERFVVVHVERATPSLKWVTGYTATQGLHITGGTSTTGGTVADDNMVEITLGHPVGVQYPCSTFTATLTT